MHNATELLCSGHADLKRPSSTYLPTYQCTYRTLLYRSKAGLKTQPPALLQALQPDPSRLAVGVSIRRLIGEHPCSEPPWPMYVPCCAPNAQTGASPIQTHPTPATANCCAISVSCRSRARPLGRAIFTPQDIRYDSAESGMPQVREAAIPQRARRGKLQAEIAQ